MVNKFQFFFIMKNYIKTKKFDMQDNLLIQGFITFYNISNKSVLF